MQVICGEWPYITSLKAATIAFKVVSIDSRVAVQVCFAGNTDVADIQGTG